MRYRLQRVAAAQWQAVRDLRLAALRDPAAPLAFLTTYDDEAARPDTFWQDRTRGAASGGAVAQYVVADDAGQWVGTATGLFETPGATDFAGRDVDRPQVHVVGVWLHPDHRGRGLIQRAIDAVAAWGEEYAAERVRLYVHADNARARAAYAKAGLEPTGVTAETPAGTEVEMARALR
jgi:RimJ/RimL family protein N-acetyltransferase